MNPVPFDTLKMAKRLEAAGFAAPQAAGAAEALAAAFIGSDLATKGDVAALRADEIAPLRAEVRSGFEHQRRDLDVLRQDMTIRLGGMILAGFGAMTAVPRFLPLHP